MPTPNPEIPNIPNTAAVATQLSFGAVRPVVLFPVRLETRFFKLDDGNTELRVRVYPDTVHIDSHEAPLTPEEVTWGQHFWEQTWRAANDKERAKAAWSQLAERFDPPRAAWIAQQLKPLNPDDRPEQPIAPADALRKKIRFPTPPTQPESWMRAPVARVLPSFWVLLGYKNGILVVNVKGSAIRESLANGPDPAESDAIDETGLDQGMQWMVNFAEAEAAGMGIRVKLNPETAAAGFDFLLVLGIRDSETGTTDSHAELSDLFNAHHYTGGMSFITPGTPSNNTADAPSGFSSNDPGQELSYHAERETPVIKPGDGSNADLFTSALGVAAGTDTFAKLPHASAKDQLDAAQMNTALWQETWGYFLSQMLGSKQAGESPLNEEDIAWTRRHFIDYVRANGPLPSLRIGKQPYGILPVTSLSSWKPPKGQESQFSRDVALRDFLLSLRNIWSRSLQRVPRLGRSDDIDQQSGFDTDLAEVLSMEGVSSNYSLRHFMGRHYFEHLWVFLSADFFANAWNLPEIEQPQPEDPPEFPPIPAGTPREERLFILREQRAEQLAFEN
ncbi:MAG TPA: hypothetical protein VFT02_04890, partial [Pyrinomonadaceae bacterium]|nr:hypothetical protein [Pyrinomonadaceae bacterium]